MNDSSFGSQTHSLTYPRLTVIEEKERVRFLQQPVRINSIANSYALGKQINTLAAVYEFTDIT